jgi:hypothetical protein
MREVPIVRAVLAWVVTAAGLAALVYGIFLTAGVGPAWITAGVGVAGCGLFLVDIDPRGRGESAEVGPEAVMARAILDAGAPRVRGVG